MSYKVESCGPTVSVCMPVYNGGKYIKEAIDSLLAQTFTDFELIISDNASTDGTQKICQDYACNDKRIKYILQRENRGGIYNFNYLLSQAKGKYFTWFACDDCLEPEYLEKTIQYLDRFEDVVACVCDFKIVDEEGELIRLEHLKEIYPYLEWGYSQKFFFRFPISNVFFALYGTFRRREIGISGINIKSTYLGLSSGIEIPFLARIAVIGKIVAIPEILRAYRVHRNSLFNTELSRVGFVSFRRRVHNWLLRLDQLYVIIISAIPLFIKFKLLCQGFLFSVGLSIYAAASKLWLFRKSYGR